MNEYKAKLIEEHKQLLSNLLDNYLYDNGGINQETAIENNQTQSQLLDNLIEYANKARETI